MKISEMTPEQIEAKRLYDKEAKRRSRAQAKLENQKLNPVRASFYEIPDDQRADFDKHVELTLKTISSELNLKFLSDLDEYMAVAVASVIFGFDHGITQIVADPEGVLVGGYFPDAVSSDVIQHIHRFPYLLKSETFTKSYKDFLKAVAAWAKKNGEYAEPGFIQDLKQEIAGTYTPPEPKQKPEPGPQPEQKNQEKPLPSTTEILERGRTELLSRINPEWQSPRPLVHDPNLTPAARRYLAGL